VTSLNIGNGPAFGYLNLTASDNFSPCPRGATSDAGWLKIVSGNNLSGSGSIGYTVDANLGRNRMGKITLGNATFTVTQAGGCDYKLSPSIFNFPSGNGGSSIQVVASSDSCDWSPVSSASWVKLPIGIRMVGNGTVNFTVDPNPGSARTATITV